MSKKRIFLTAFVLVVTISVLASGQVSTYEDFVNDFLNERAQEIKKDGKEFESLMDSWSNGEIAQSEVVAKLEEMEAKAEGYIEDVLRISAPEGKFDRYKQAVYVFVTWSNIVGVFRDGMTDIDTSKLDAAATLSNFFEARVSSFDKSGKQTD